VTAERALTAEPVLPAPPVRRRTSLREYLESLLVTVLLALFGTTFVLQAFKIPSPSMQPALLIGDHVLVNKFIFGGRGAWYDRLLPYREIRRGDIIVFRFPYDDHPHYVKRVIGLPGDRIKILDRVVHINGAPLLESYAVHRGPPDTFGDNFPPVSSLFALNNVRREWASRLLLHTRNGELLVPPGKLFVMGDNRDASLDSRFWGFADRESVIGRPLFIYWSVEAASPDDSSRSLPARVAATVYAITQLPARTRWGRILRRVE
jgi:signal peptidase I